MVAASGIGFSAVQDSSPRHFGGGCRPVWQFRAVGASPPTQENLHDGDYVGPGSGLGVERCPCPPGARLKHQRMANPRCGACSFFRVTRVANFEQPVPYQQNGPLVLSLSRLTMLERSSGSSSRPSPPPPYSVGSCAWRARSCFR